MRKFWHILFVVTALAFAVSSAMGCATTGGSENNNTNNQNNTNLNNNNNVNTNTNGGDCAATCPTDKICVGPDAEHRTCVDKCDGNTCPAPYTCCYGGCVNLLADTNNCGSCWNDCDSGVSCINGICVDACNNMCSVSEKCCSGTCTNIQTDKNNCGDCGRVCDSVIANSCTSGYCTCGGGAECTGGRVCCTTSCKDLTTDVTNCGGCGTACAPGETCNQSFCQCGTGPGCTFGSCCGNECVNTTTSNTHCGYCNHPCTSPETCSGGQCLCNGQTCQAGSMGQPATCCSNGCVIYDLSDPMQIVAGVTNCGSCGNNCAPMVPCLMGMCFSG